MNRVPPWPRWLGLAGLLPQFACLAALWFGPLEWRYTALAIAWGYAALIYSFLGGLWWGMAASASARGEAVPGWLWVASVGPSLLALLTYLPWIFAGDWPAPSLGLLGLLILTSVWVDLRIETLAPPWWMALRLPLSLGLGGATLLIAFA